MAIQIDVFGNDVVKNTKKKYEVHYYIGYNHGYTIIEAYTKKQAMFLVRKEHDFKCMITDIYEI